MCYSKELSMNSFLFGMTTSLLLIIFGKKENLHTNLAIGLFFMFVSLMQLVEYLIWSDINCVNGMNKVGTKLGPILNHLQPIVFLILLNLFVKSKNIIPTSIIVVLNVVYCVYVFHKYSDFKKECTSVNTLGHLYWDWKQNFNYISYFFIMILNTINYTSPLINTTSIYSYLLLIFSAFKFNQNIGEFWCLFVNSSPLIALFYQYL